MSEKRKQWLRLSNRLMSGALAVLGLASCNGGNGPGGVEMYGTPSATYRVKGKVVDAQTGVPVPGIQVITGGVYPSNGEWGRSNRSDTLHTDKDGAFAVDAKGSFPTNKYRFIWEDTDGTANETYKKDSVDVAITGKYVGGDDWYKGEATVEATLKITKK